MTIEALKDSLGDFAKDIRLNLGTVLRVDDTTGLSQGQIYGIALASAYSTKNLNVIKALAEEAAGILSGAEINAAKAAATIMAMNNVYYRFVHLTSDKEYGKMPARLRMNIIANPGIAKVDFELYCLAVSAINGCGMCIDAHTREVAKAGVSNVAIQTVIRIAAVVNAVAQADVIR
jgi:alkyl hydroperoxide reductase subunit D